MTGKQQRNDTAPAAKLADVRNRVAKAAALAGRRDDEICLIAVSKTRSAAEIERLIAAGATDFGENRVQEIQEKWPAIRARHPHVRLHFIGRLQSNKAAEAMALCDAIHSLDRRSLVDAIARAVASGEAAPELFVQVNIGDEPQKGGCAIADLPALLDYAAEQGLAISGLMAVPPFDVEPAPYFALLAELAVRNGLVGLSMGMSSDFEIAAILGATHVRIGSELFGPRV
ncbi:MAG: YggS family pyridoxal phosphate-dependent enzyme [Sphingomonadales bacterium]|nr:YggS family pyridoxal phosphate-dependent enzyme [Sphingomonadales bacterium]